MKLIGTCMVLNEEESKFVKMIVLADAKTFADVLATGRLTGEDKKYAENFVRRATAWLEEYNKTK